jgi:hypothetical protein
MNTAENLVFAPWTFATAGGGWTGIIWERIQDSPPQCAHPRGDGPLPFTVRLRAWGWSALPPLAPGTHFG